MEYKKLVRKLTPKEFNIKNLLSSFISGGVIGLISYDISMFFNSDIMLLFWIMLSSIFTGLGLFDDLVDKFKMGIIIPITGFAHSVTASSLEYKREGFITGIGSNYFKLAGSVILSGVISTTFFYLIKEVIECI